MTPHERRERIERIINGGPVTVAFLAKTLHLPDEVSVIAKDLRAMSKDGRVILHRVRHATFNTPEVRHWPRKLTLLVAIKSGGQQPRV